MIDKSFWSIDYRLGLNIKKKEKAQIVHVGRYCTTYLIAIKSVFSVLISGTSLINAIIVN